MVIGRQILPTTGKKWPAPSLDLSAFFAPPREPFSSLPGAKPQL